MTPSHPDTLAALLDLQSQPLSIIRVSEPISNPTNPTTTNARTSDISASGLTDDATNPTPISLAADLSHYRDLFSKLRFSYLEQVTKEKFLRAIVGDPPLIIENAENVELERQLGEVKTVLKEQKEHVARMVQELERKGRELAGRYEQIGLKTELLGQLPREIQGVEDKIRKLREETKGSMVGMGGGLGLDRVLELTREKDRQKKEVERGLKALQGEIPGKGRLLERLEGELKGLDREKEKAVEGAREAVKNRESGGAAWKVDDTASALLRVIWRKEVSGALDGVVALSDVKSILHYELLTFTPVMPSSEALTDDYLAQLLAKDARDRTVGYSSHGLQSFLPKRPTTNAPKPNTRFLKNVIKETDNHNAALRAKETADARARLRGIDARDHGERPRHHDGHSSKRRRTYGDENYGRLEGSRPSHRQRHEVRQGCHHKDFSTSSEIERSRHKRHHRQRRSRSTSPESDRGRRRKPKHLHRSRSPRKSHRSHHRRRRHSRTPSPSPSPFSRTSPLNKKTSPPPSPTHSASDSDPLASLIGPLPPSATSTFSKPLPRGRGSTRTHSNIDTHFAPSYDPTLDIPPTTPSPTDDWDNALEALRDRARWQKAGGERLRAAGFTDEEVAKWERSGGGRDGGEERVEDVKWKGRGEGREWDRGKVVGEDGAVGVEVEWGRLKGT